MCARALSKLKRVRSARATRRWSSTGGEEIVRTTKKYKREREQRKGGG